MQYVLQYRLHLMFFGRDWLGRLIADHEGYSREDYGELERRFGGSSHFKDMPAGFNIFLFWNRE
jgi:hypothetical protein